HQTQCRQGTPAGALRQLNEHATIWRKQIARMMSHRHATGWARRSNGGSVMRVRAWCVVIAVAVAVVAGCGESPPDNSETASASPHDASSVDPSFFAWQQAQRYGNEKADIADTVHAVTFYSALMFRDNARSRDELKSVTTQHTFNEYGGAKTRIYPGVRGDVTMRLISISIHKNQASATATWCANKADQKIRKRGSTQWKECYRDAPYSAYSSEFIKSASS